MSLINDALKRAKQAQGQRPASTTPGPQLRPVEPVAASSHVSRLAMPAITVAVIGIALFLAWRLAHTNGSVQHDVAVPQAPVVASVAPAAQPAPVAQRAPARAAEPTAAVPPISVQAVTLGTRTETSSSTGNPATPVPGAAATDVAVTIVPANLPATPEKPAPPKLQGIMYQPGRPAAMISGKMVFVGDKFGGWRVAAIDQESATLVGAGLTNILTLPQ